jgi:alpha-ribazole phosphatase
MKLFLIRHGQTAWNIARRYQGHSDVPLNETGQKQAKALSDRFSTQHIDAIYSSDLSRATETASAILQKSGYNPDLHPDARLREVNFGDWEGMTYNEIKEKYPKALLERENDIYKSAPPNGETLEQLTMRVQSLLAELLAKHENQTVLAVAHGGVLRVLLCCALGLHPTMYWQFYMSTASVSEVSFYPDGAILNLLNDTSHLPKSAPKKT